MITKNEIVFVEKKWTVKWLTEELAKNPATVGKWYTDVSQFNQYTLNRIAMSFIINNIEFTTGKD